MEHLSSMKPQMPFNRESEALSHLLLVTIDLTDLRDVSEQANWSILVRLPYPKADRGERLQPLHYRIKLCSIADAHT